ncbi:hypothetical protein NPIL_49041 [Nephila pilipes]|uniref:Uncharacterized protein n=1 Tax=Nephila pilipes TaxID=299642 RepID=A0A8X6KAP9_NEPPI|nr:hypothetical protein NPIL_49041 [Nephila pilipes]
MIFLGEPILILPMATPFDSTKRKNSKKPTAPSTVARATSAEAEPKQTMKYTERKEIRKEQQAAVKNKETGIADGTVKRTDKIN